MPPTRRTVATALVATAALASGCSTTTETPDAGSSSTDTAAADLALSVASFDLAVGEDRRLLAGLFTPERQIVVGGDVSLRVFALDTEADSAPEPVSDTLTATFLPVPGKAPTEPLERPTVVTPADAAGVYQASVDFTQPGPHGVVVRAQLSDGTVAEATANFQVQPAPLVVDVGDPAPAVDNATIHDDVELVTLDSRAQGDGAQVPDPALHTVRVSEALADRARPLVVVVSTPTYCVSQFCGPITDTIDDLAAVHGDDVDFVHLEVWRDFEDAQLNDAAAAWIQTPDGGNEPWVFYVERDGTVAARWDNVLDEAQLVELLEQYSEQPAR